MSPMNFVIMHGQSANLIGGHMILKETGVPRISCPRGDT